MRRVLFLVFGTGAIGLAFLLGGYLAPEAWSPGAVGFQLLLSAPGLALLARATEVHAGRYLFAVVALAVVLLGLDVTDSARDVVVAGGYLVALLGAAALVGSLARQRSQTRSG